MNKIDKLIAELCSEGVDYFKLSEISNQYAGFSGAKDKWAKSGNCQFIDYLNVFNNIKVNVKDLKFATIDNYNKTTLKRGDILFTAASETPHECAISSVVEDEISEGVFIDDHLFAIRLNEDFRNKINIGFAKYLFRTDRFRTEVNKVVRGVTRFYVSKKDFMKSTVPIPPIEIQNEIVRILDNFTDLEADLKAELEARTQQYEYYRNKLLDYSTGFVGLPKIDKMIKELCPNGIITSNFESITTNLSSGKNTMKNTTGEYPVYGSTGKIGFTNEYKYEGNSILIARVGANCGLVYFVSEKYDVTDNTILVKIKTNQNIKYFFYLLKNMNLNQFAKGGGQPLITSSLLKSLEIPLPPLEIQNEIVKILDSFSDLVTSNSEGLPAEIKARKQQFEYYRNKLLNFEERQ